MRKGENADDKQKTKENICRISNRKAQTGRQKMSFCPFDIGRWDEMVVGPKWTHLGRSRSSCVRSVILVMVPGRRREYGDIRKDADYKVLTGKTWRIRSLLEKLREYGVSRKDAAYTVLTGNL